MSTVRNQLPFEGVWHFVPDEQDAGIRERWFTRTDSKAGQTVPVPGLWRQWAPEYQGPAWLFHQFDAEAPPRDWQANLYFEAIGCPAEVWLNGIRLGRHRECFNPAVFNVAAHLRTGANYLALRLEYPDVRAQRGGGNIPLPRAFDGARFAGLWGKAGLHTLPREHIESVFIHPDIRRKRIAVQVATAAEDTEVLLRVAGTSCETRGPAGALGLELEEFEFWSSETPRCYTLECALLRGETTIDALSVPFGMREFTIKDGRFYFNNRPYSLRGVHHVIDYPGRLPVSEWGEEALRELGAAKDAGFHLVFLRGGMAPEAVLDAADSLGMMIGIEAAQELDGESTESLEALVRRARNHPSVVFWTAAQAQDAKDAEDTAARCNRIRALDPSRVVFCALGASSRGAASARALRPYREEFETCTDMQVFQGAPVALVIENYLRLTGAEQQLCLLSAFGAEAMGPGSPETSAYLAAAEEGYRERSLDRMFGTFEGFSEMTQAMCREATVLQLDALRANPRFSGYCYSRLRDAGPAQASGILDAHGAPKPALPLLAAAQEPLRPLIQMTKTNLAPREEVTVNVLLANELRIEGRADLSLQVVGPTNQVLWKKKRGVKLPRHGKLLWNGAIAASGSSGTHKFVVRVLQGNRILTQSAMEFHVFPEPQATDTPIHLLDPKGEWKERCGSLARLENLFAPIHIVPPLANSVRGYPDNELMQVLAQVRGGAVALIFSPPRDWNELATQIEDGLEATSRSVAGAATPAYHYAKMHPVFAGLPSRGLMRQPYRNVAPFQTFMENSDEDICGCFFAGAPGEAAGWGNNILVRRHGDGRVVFIHLRILERLGIDTVAAQLFVNLLNHFARRSVPSKSPLAPAPKAVEWMRKEREWTGRWMVLGEFANNELDAGHDAVYPPEQSIDLEATYPGWYQALNWRPWVSLAAEEHAVDLQRAFTPIWQAYPRHDYATGYAYAELLVERRQPAALCLGLRNATKVWVNGKLHFTTESAPPPDSVQHEAIPVYLKQGRNTLLVKCSKGPGPFGFTLSLETERGEALQVNWWR